MGMRYFTKRGNGDGDGDGVKIDTCPHPDPRLGIDFYPCSRPHPRRGRGFFPDAGRGIPAPLPSLSATWSMMMMTLTTMIRPQRASYQHSSPSQTT